jgi:signal transduction histidine kinase
MESGRWQRVSSDLRRLAGRMRRTPVVPDSRERTPVVPFVVVSAILLALALSGFAAAIIARTYDQAIADAEHRLQDFTDVLAEHAALVFDDVDRTLQAANARREQLLRAGEWGPEAGERPYQALVELRRGSAAAANLSWIDEHGERLYTALTPSPLPLNLADRPHFRAHRDEASLGVLIEAPNLSTTTGRFLLPVTRRFDLPDGSFGGITAALVDPADFAAFYRTMTHRQRLSIQLVQSDGTVLVREPSLNVAGASITQGLLVGRYLPTAPAGIFSGPGIFDGIERIVSYKVIPKLPLLVTMSMNRADALADWYLDAMVLATFCILLVGMIAGGAGLSVRQIRQRGRQQREQAEANDRLRHAEKQRALGTLVGGIAHEINSALVPIMTLGEMTEEALPEGSFERDSVAQMRQSADKIEKLIRRVLAFSREEQALGPRLDLEDFAARLLDSLRRELPPNIALVKRIEPDIGAVLAGEDKLTQVFTDLVANAAHAIGKRPGQIEIAAGRAFHHSTPSAASHADGETDFVRFSVTDDGPGIPAVVRERLFEPFFTTKEAGKGVGLGLYTARRVITELGGYLDVESGTGKGACFSIILPRAPVQAPGVGAALAGMGGD